MDKKIKEATSLVDIILKGDYSQFQALKAVDYKLNEVENQLDNVPDQNIPSLLDTLFKELSQDSFESEEEDEEQEDNQVVDPLASVEESKEQPQPIEEVMKRSVRLLVTEESYREFFKSMLKKWNIKSPTDLDDAKKKEFFAAVDREWKGNKESD